MFKLRRVARLLCSLALFSALALVGHSGGALASGIVASTTGSGHFTGSNGEYVTFAHNAVLHADGTVSGHYQINIRSLDAAFRGPVTCLNVIGNRAWVGGIAEQVVSSNPNLAALEGQEMWFQVRDNGEGGDDPPDITTSIGITPIGGPPGEAAAYCQAAPEPRTPLQIQGGNIQVTSGE
jgi:hypothetical protein